MSPTVEGGGAGRVLVVDDQENMCWVLSRLLSERGHVVRAAYTSARALDALEDFDCQVAVVDYRLRESSGIALIVEMTSRLPRLRSVLMTSHGGEALRSNAIERSLFAYLDKPFSNDLMIETVESGIREWESGDADARSRPRTLFPGRARPRA